MKTYKVICDSLIFGDDVLEKGKTFRANPHSSNVKAFLRFEQVEEVAEAVSEDEKKSDENGPQTVKELTAALEELEITIPEGAKKADLQGLYDEAVKEGDE